MSKVLIMATAAAAALGLAASAHAETLVFTYVEDGGLDFSFDQSATPTPLGYALGDYTDVAISNFTGNVGPYSSIVWYSAGASGQFNTPDNAYVVFGPQVYSGPESAPIFATGTYAGADQTNGLAGTLTITAVPEPATWAMMILGLGMTGALLRRRNGAVVAA
jgi:hypothetical protein